MAKDAFRATLPGRVAKVMAAVVARYSDDAPEVVECCPQGRTVFSRTTDDQVAGHLQTLINGVTAHLAELGAPLLAEATAILTTWNSIYNASESASGAKTATIAEKNAARENLQLMLFLNLLKLAEMWARQPAKLALYMQQSLLEDHPAQEPPPPTP
jgi:mitochondrial fission protein ELM1